MTEPTDTPPAADPHPTGGAASDRSRARPRRGAPRESNYRLWLVVGALLLVLPLAVVGVRGLSAGADRAEAPVPGTGGVEAGASPSGADPDPSADPPEQSDPSGDASGSTPEQEDPTGDASGSEEQGPARPSEEPTVPASGPQEYVTVDRPVSPEGDSGALLRYRVRIEENLDLDARQTAETVADVLNDERSWRGDGSVRFEQVGPDGDHDFTIYVVTPGTTDELCAPLQTQGEVSCRNGDNVVLNAKRWVLGVEAYDDDLTGYRQYLVNHEVGHRLGYGHVDCSGDGEPAPIMMQQTKGVGGCDPHPWVKPSDR